MTTIGVDFKLKNKVIDGKQTKIQIWDTAGQERFRTITASYYRGAHGIILVYDVTSEKSFDHVAEWYDEIREHAAEDVKILLVGNKIDKEQHRIIKTEQGKALADKYKMDFMETSAKKGEQVVDAFDKIIVDVVRSKEQNPSQTPGPAQIRTDAPRLHDDESNNGGNGGCC
eukprot:CAMPEP_0117424798 /NCGR_PEP_ID=MMETSP0758-20121206/5161_1 /TAXON_ID=63605 /ORGANISM="Percolomonas cosmopolitus, Strain AE-1 (ATCC 50343)" /LENGTH=170 /DNA_ID=CAMNT_0005208825 /DNA_START=164 /DNA_END=676 /DNA_ORIENTATION=-